MFLRRFFCVTLIRQWGLEQPRHPVGEAEHAFERAGRGDEEPGVGGGVGVVVGEVVDCIFGGRERIGREGGGGEGGVDDGVGGWRGGEEVVYCD